MADIFIFSTFSTNISYVEYLPGPPGGIPREGRKVTILGGAHVATKQLVTPRGVVTKITPEDLSFLCADEHFQEHVKSGFISYEDKKVDIDDVVRTMNAEDKSRPLTDADYDKGGRAYKIIDLEKGLSVKAPSIGAA